MKHTLKLIYRNFRKNLTINLINLGGLALSMAVVLMLAAYCYHELTTDLHHENVDQTYLITHGNQKTYTPAILSEHLKAEVPDVKHVVRISDTWETPVINRMDGEAFATELIFADEDFFKLFTYQKVTGNLAHALTEPMSIVLTKEEANRIFGYDEAVGKSIKINNKHEMKITAVIDGAQHNSLLTFNAIAPVSSRKIIQPNEDEFTNWGYQNFQTFIRTKKHVDTKNVSPKIENLFAENSKFSKSGGVIQLLPLRSLYFSGLEAPWANHLRFGSYTKTIILMVVAILILLIALINYVNITTYGLNERLSQTGIFKVLGANKNHILKHVLLESSIVFFISFWLSIMLAEMIQPYIHQFTGINIFNNIILSPGFIMMALLISILMGVMANIIPSIKHAIIDPVCSLKKLPEQNQKVGYSRGQ